MTSDQAHDIACRAMGADSRIQTLLQRHGDALYSSLCPPSEATEGRWVELVLLGVGEATHVDDPCGRSVVLARCIVNPDSGSARVVIEDSAEQIAAADRGNVN
jgi:hypothetical protein